MTVGRPPKPTRVKELAGNPGRRPLNTREPQFPVKGLTCPDWLSPVARREWQRVVPLLRKVGLVTAADRTVLAAYCQAFARWRQAEAIIEKHGLTVELETKAGGVYLQQRPEVSIAQKYHALMLAAGARLGFDPSSRSRLSVPETPPVDEFAAFLGGKFPQGAPADTEPVTEAEDE